MYTNEISFKELEKNVCKMHDYEKYIYYIDHIVNLAFEKFSEVEFQYDFSNKKDGVKFAYWICLKKFYDTYLGMLITRERNKMDKKAARDISASITIRYNEFIQKRKLFNMQEKTNSENEVDINSNVLKKDDKKGWKKIWNLFNLKKTQKNL